MGQVFLEELKFLRANLTVRGPSFAPSDAKILTMSYRTIVVLTKFFWEFRTGQSF
jgi:hypothetical protein